MPNPRRLVLGVCPLLLLGCSDGSKAEGNDTGHTESSNGSNAGGTSGDGDNTANSVSAGGTAVASGAGGSTDATTATSTSGSGAAGGGAQEVADRLGRDHFLIGMGNDLSNDHNQDGAYTLGVTLDLHYAYLVGLPGRNGWPDWNANGSFVNILTDSARDHGVVPMFTLYSMAADGENNLAALTDEEYMAAYWEGAKLLFERLDIFDDPAVVHFEPDFWAYTQRAENDPTQQDVLVGSLASDCADQPDNMVGMGHCLVALARKYAPKALVGFHASGWAGTPEAVTSYLNALGAADADLVVVEALDRDAGCFEAGNDPNCTRTDGPWYWDETNQTSPNFHEHLAWAQSISEGIGRPLLWWQLPFGVPSDTPGGEPGHYRDNRVKYLFEHVDEYIAAGGVGAVFGVGAGNQTYIDTDGDQFKNAVTKYFANPFEL